MDQFTQRVRALWHFECACWKLQAGLMHTSAEGSSSYRLEPHSQARTPDAIACVWMRSDCKFHQRCSRWDCAQCWAADDCDIIGACISIDSLKDWSGFALVRSLAHSPQLGRMNYAKINEPRETSESLRDGISLRALSLAQMGITNLQRCAANVSAE